MKVEERVLEACDPDDPGISFEYQMGRTVYRWWLTEKESRTLTKAERSHLERLLRENRLEKIHAIGAWGRGFILRVPRYRSGCS